MTRWALSFDLGTSFCAAAIGTDGRVDLVEVNGERRMPSAVLLTPDGTLLAGHAALYASLRFPGRSERSPRRYVGRAPMLLGGEPVPAAAAVAALLRPFVAQARRRSGGVAPECLVVTHPVAWSQSRRNELRAAAERVLPGVPVVLLAEPLASATHYAGDRTWTAAGGTVAVFDMSGTASTVTVMAVDRDRYDVVGRAHGDPDTGGDAFDQRVYHHFGARLRQVSPQWWDQVQTNPDHVRLAAAMDLLTHARLARESLSDRPECRRYVAGADMHLRLSRAELHELIGIDVGRAGRLLAETIGDTANRLRGVLLTGGVSRTPLVEQTVRSAYGTLVRTTRDPKGAVALGAARWARA
jgi:molecular chaperone DnaK (HSP70)